MTGTNPQQSPAVRPRNLPLPKKIVFSAIAVVGFLAIVELTLRVSGAGAKPHVGVLRFGYDTGIPIFDSDGIEREGETFQDFPLFAADPRLFWKPIANTPFTGADGLRLKTPASLLKEEGVYRLAIIGGSCSFLGTKLYPDRFAEMVLENTSRKVEVVNASCPGYSSFQGVRRLAAVWPWQPDLLIVYFGWNDHWKSLNGLTDRGIVEQQLLSDQTRRWLRMSRLYTTLKSIRASLTPPVSVSDSPVRVPPDDYRDNLQAILQDAREIDCPVVFITAPSGFVDGQMPPWTYGFFGQYYAMNQQEVDDIPRTHMEYNDIVREVAESSDSSALLDIERLWGVASAQEKIPLLFRTDRIHLTEQGHQEIAVALYNLWYRAYRTSEK